MAPFKIDDDFLFSVLADLVSINSINPSLTTDGPGEAEIAAYIANTLNEIGLDVTLHEPEPGRVSVVGILKGTGDGRSLMWNAHTDTVGVEGMANPFTPIIKNGRMYGRGTQDMKGSIAVCIAAAKALVDSGAKIVGDILVAAVADEEYASVGTANLLRHYDIDAAIVTEPSEMNICLAHKGFIWVEVETVGKAAHGSRFTEGIDANMHMGRFLAELDKLGKDLILRKKHNLLSAPSLHAAIIQGGTELSTYSASCKLQFERRTVPGETEAQAMSEFQMIIDQLSSADPTFKASLNSFFSRDPFEALPDSAIVTALEQAAIHVLGKKQQPIGETWWMDSALLAAAGIDTVIMGPIGEGIHAHEEWVDLDSLVDLAQILAQTAIIYNNKH